MPQKIYIITESNDNTACKIGIARDPVSRRRQLQTGNRRHLQIQHIITMPRGIRARSVETEVHNLLDDVQYEGGTEWFQIHPDDALRIVNEHAGIATPWRWWSYLVLPLDLLGRFILRLLLTKEPV